MAQPAGPVLDDFPPDDMVAVEWRRVQVTYGQVQRFIRTHYKGPCKLARFKQDGIKGSVEIHNFNITPRELANMLNDKLIKTRPVFAYPTFKDS